MEQDIATQNFLGSCVIKLRESHTMLVTKKREEREGEGYTYTPLSVVGAGNLLWGPTEASEYH